MSDNITLAGSSVPDRKNYSRFRLKDSFDEILSNGSNYPHPDDQSTDVYKVSIDKKAIKEFFLNENPTRYQIAQVQKVFNVVMLKYFSSYYSYSKDLLQYAFLAVLERKKSYLKEFSAYTYAYSIIRNEVGNKIRKMIREVNVDDFTSFKENVTDSPMAELPPEVLKYKSYLLGTENFKCIRVPRKDVLNLLLFFRLHDQHRKVDVPLFVQESDKSVQVLYRLLKELIG